MGRKSFFFYFSFPINLSRTNFNPESRIFLLSPDPRFLSWSWSCSTIFRLSLRNSSPVFARSVTTVWNKKKRNVSGLICGAKINWSVYFEVFTSWPRGRKKIYVNLPLWPHSHVVQPLIKPLTPFVGSLLYVTPYMVFMWDDKYYWHLYKIKFSFVATRPRCHEGKLTGILFAATLPCGYAATT